MIDHAPVLLAAFFVLIAFIYSMREGVVSLLTSGLALAVGVAVFLVCFKLGPAAARQFLDIDLTWKFLLAVSGGLAALLFLISRFIFSAILRALFNRDGFLHPLSDGIGGGLLSIGPSLLTVVVFFLCVRLAGTVLELNYIDSLARPGITAMGGSIPPYPMSVRWRDGLDSLPFLGDGLDLVDPISRRGPRNVAALVLALDGPSLQIHLKREIETGPLAELSDSWAEVAADPAVARANEKMDRVALLIAPAVQDAAEDLAIRRKLRRLVLRPTISEFVKSIEPAPVPEALETQL